LVSLSTCCRTPWRNWVIAPSSFGTTASRVSGSTDEFGLVASPPPGRQECRLLGARFPPHLPPRETLDRLRLAGESPVKCRGLVLIIQTGPAPVTRWVRNCLTRSSSRVREEDGASKPMTEQQGIFSRARRVSPACPPTLPRPGALFVHRSYSDL